jgi:hypothetical protein
MAKMVSSFSTPMLDKNDKPASRKYRQAINAVRVPGSL